MYSIVPLFSVTYPLFLVSREKRFGRAGALYPWSSLTSSTLRILPERSRNYNSYIYSSRILLPVQRVIIIIHSRLLGLRLEIGSLAPHDVRSCCITSYVSVHTSVHDITHIYNSVVDSIS